MATAPAHDGAYSFDARVAVEHVRASDPMLARVIDAVGPFRLQLKRAPSSFAALAEAVVYQQLSGKAAATIFARVRAVSARARRLHRRADAARLGRKASGCRPVAREAALAARPRAARDRRRDPHARRGSSDGRRGDFRAPHRGGRYRPADLWRGFEIP